MYLRRRSGASLLEVLIATVILLTSIAALTSQALVGVRAANRTRLQSMAMTICQSVLAEQSTASTLTNSPAMAASGFDDWMVQTRVESLHGLSARIDPSIGDQLRLVSVTAWQSGVNEGLSKTTLSKIVRQPIALPGIVHSSPGIP